MRFKSRKIHVNGQDFRWRIQGKEYCNDYYIDKNAVDSKFLEIAQRYGLGSVRNIILHVTIKLYNKAVSTIHVQYHGISIDGFMGPEDSLQITPKIIANIIQESIHYGWHPKQKKDFTFEFFEQRASKTKPAVLVIPNFNNDIVDDYDNIIDATKLDV